jgi:hypothetical protein
LLRLENSAERYFRSADRLQMATMLLRVMAKAWVTAGTIACVGIALNGCSLSERLKP